MGRKISSRDILERGCVEYGKFLEGDSNADALKSMSVIVSNAVKNELTEKQRTAVELCIYQNMKVSEAADMLGINKSTVSRHLKRSAEIIRDSLKYVDFTKLS